MKLHLIHLLTIGTIFAAVPALAQTYTIQDVGLAPGTTYPLGIGLNDVGQACGFCESPNGPVATFSSEGQLVILAPTNPKYTASAKGIDNSGNVVGVELPTQAPVNIERALIWSNGGKAHDITSTSIFPGGEAALAVNKVSGEVVGIGFTSSPMNNEWHMFTFANGQTVDLGPTTANVEPIAINDSGLMIVNFTNGEQAIYSNGTFTPIAQLPNATVTANAINNSGVVVGEIDYSTNTLVPHAGLYSNGVWTDLGTLSGAARGTKAVSINSSGQIVGLAEGKPSYPKTSVPDMSCILQNGTWVELNSLIPTNSGFNLNLSVPVSINDAGQILIDIKTASGNYVHSVLLTPKQ